MPPSRHSSSHHSSSHHSSHSSSHHSSSRSRSSSYRSSSHSSSRSSYRSYMPVRRTRTSQPYGWNTRELGEISRFHCAVHDYDYYPKSWIAEDGRRFDEGYYDENGQHYNNMIMAGGTTMLKCDYCDNRMVYTWTDGALPTCDKCGAQLKIDVQDKVENDGAGYTRERSDYSRSGFKILLLILGSYFAMHFIAAIVAGALALFSYKTTGKNSGQSAGTKSTSTVKNSIYVDEIGRTCYKDGEDWYDSVTQCWFWYNNEESPYQWQYWYEGISSDYGDYGWMEYDMDDNAWYVEASDNNWVHLPDNYDTSKLWHMNDEYVNDYD